MCTLPFLFIVIKKTLLPYNKPEVLLLEEADFTFDNIFMLSSIFANNDFYESGDMQNYAGLLKTLK